MRGKAMTQISKKTIIAAVLVALAFILTVTALVISVVNRGENNGDGKESDKAAESVAFDSGAVSTDNSEQTDYQPTQEPDEFNPEVKYESGEVSIDINDLA